jgi:hypothetical protein
VFSNGCFALGQVFEEEVEGGLVRCGWQYCRAFGRNIKYPSGEMQSFTSLVPETTAQKSTLMSHMHAVLSSSSLGINCVSSRSLGSLGILICAPSLSDRRCFDLGFWPSNPSHVHHALARERWSLLLDTSKHTQLACIELTAQLLQCDSSTDSWNESCSVVTLRSVDLVSCICDRSLHCDTATKAPTHIHIFRVGGSKLFGVTDAFKHHLI